MITLDGEDKLGRPWQMRLAIAALVIAGIFVPGIFLTAKSGDGFVMDFIGGLAVALPVLALMTFLLKKSREKIGSKFSRFSKEAKKK
jgi:hypothetical protein